MAEDGFTKDGTTDCRNECCERLAYYGINTNLVNYLKFQLNQSNVVAVNNVANWSGTCYVMPLLGAFLADAYLGRYWTIAGFSIICLCKLFHQLFLRPWNDIDDIVSIDPWTKTIL
ncbi:hypothetical protein SADUNF_Sadunf16G0094100 [Salix dunnii]|uniref:Uncharacterized protein n=1 Tax=Salix dunnii TaxID=1413687 RepID=A0A835JAR4_9ROSI|nr:hypothetical protein SADUNF_Sadunf16G0094100 [Salix dunnii]